MKDAFFDILIGTVGATGADEAKNLTYRLDITSTVSAVPVPAALPLLVTGLAGLGFFAHRRKAA